MSRAISIALNTFEVHGFEFPSLKRLRHALARAAHVEATAAAIKVHTAHDAYLTYITILLYILQYNSRLEPSSEVIDVL